MCHPQSTSPSVTLFCYCLLSAPLVGSRPIQYLFVVLCIQMRINAVGSILFGISECLEYPLLRNVSSTLYESNLILNNKQVLEVC
jgi:hypothetical protein